MGLLVGGGDLMLGGDFTTRVDLVSTGADGSGDEDLLPLMDANGVLL